MALDKEAVLNELISFEKKLPEITKIPDILESYLANVARSGDTEYPWNKVKPLIKRKMELVINEFKEKHPPTNIPDLPNVKAFDFYEMKKEIMETVDSFYGSPFTIQRICELLKDPYRYYKRTDKFMRGLEKNVLVVSTIEPKSAKSELQNHKNLFGGVAASSSSSYQNPSPSYVNGVGDSSSMSPMQSDYCPVSRVSMMSSPSSPSSPAPLQQLDSFTTVFASPPSTPLAVVSDISAYDAASSPSSSSSSSSDSSPQHPSSSPPPCTSSDSVSDTSVKFNGDAKEVGGFQDLSHEYSHSAFDSLPESQHLISGDEMKVSDVSEAASNPHPESSSSTAPLQSAFVDCSKKMMEMSAVTDEASQPSLELSNGGQDPTSESGHEEENADANGVVTKMELDDVKMPEENEKSASEEIRLVTEHLKETVASEPQQIPDTASNISF